MSPFEETHKIVRFLTAALECSIYHAPTDSGLTYNELLEVGGRIGLQAGELGDAMDQVGHQYFGQRDGRFQLQPHDASMLMHFTGREEPDYRNPRAFDFVFDQLGVLARANGIRHARIERGVLVERAANAALDRTDVQVAITIMLIAGVLEENQSVIGFPPGRSIYASPSLQMEQASQRAMMGPTIRREARARAYPIVNDVIARRYDGRPHHAEPLDAFADALVRLGYSSCRPWWSQIVAEFRGANCPTSPVSAIIMAAAIVEGALAFVAKHAHALDLGVMGSKTFEGKPNTWSIGDLVGGAAAGRDSAILDPSTRQRADMLIRSRQRIHPGRMLTDFPAGPPDLRPEEARDAKTTAEQVVRCVLDWLQRFPAS